MSTNLSFAHTIVPKSNQLNADDLVLSPLDVVIAKVTRGSTEQPMAIHMVGRDGKPYYPCKGMRRVLLELWGDTAGEWSGRRLRLVRDPSVTWAGEAVGGIRIDGMSDIRGSLTIPVTVAKAKKVKMHIEKLAPMTAQAPMTLEKFNAWIDAAMKRGWTKEQVITLLGVESADKVPEDDRRPIVVKLRENPPVVEDAPVVESAPVDEAAAGDEEGGEV